MVNYHGELSKVNRASSDSSPRLDFFFDVFLQQLRPVSTSEYMKQVEAYNQACKESVDLGEQSFFAEVVRKFPEFEAAFDKHKQESSKASPDLLQFLIDHSPMLKNEENRWMKSVLQIVRTTSVYFQPQIRTKIMNEGWASYWHETLFLQDDRICGHEIPFARINAGATTKPRVGLNPYALGMRLFYFIEEAANRGCYSHEYRRLNNMEQKRHYDRNTGKGRDFIFKVRENYSDFTFINGFVDQDFIDKNKLFVAGQRLNEERMVWQYYVKSRRAEDYRQMVFDSLYHPPKIAIDHEKSREGTLFLNHIIEGKPLVQEYIANTMLGIEFLWGGPVCLETSDAEVKSGEEGTADEISWKRVRYQMKERKLERAVI